MEKPKTKTYIRKSIFHDPLEASFVVQEGLQFCCENCTHFGPESRTCSLGFVAENHLRETQSQQYETGGTVALCRFLEID